MADNGGDDDNSHPGTATQDYAAIPSTSTPGTRRTSSSSAVNMTNNPSRDEPSRQASMQASQTSLQSDSTRRAPRPRPLDYGIALCCHVVATIS